MKIVRLATKHNAVIIPFGGQSATPLHCTVCQYSTLLTLIEISGTACLVHIVCLSEDVLRAFVCVCVCVSV